MRVAVLASGEGTTLQALIDAVHDRRLDAQVVVVISNNRESGALRRASAAGSSTVHLSSVTHPEPEALDAAICRTLSEPETDVVVLAGYMKKIGPQTLGRFSGKIINTHPSLLPRHGGKGMYGRRVHDAVLASGENETGVSVHLVDSEYDTGSVIAQVRIPILPNTTAESLEREVQALEREFLCTTLQKIS
ncbi:MAG: phosphoribosylglycinamide formyltransferase, partial [Verrucomicrobiaceae bacterium]